MNENDGCRISKTPNSFYFKIFTYQHLLANSQYGPICQLGQYISVGQVLMKIKHNQNFRYGKLSGSFCILFVVL